MAEGLITGMAIGGALAGAAVLFRCRKSMETLKAAINSIEKGMYEDRLDEGMGGPLGVVVDDFNRMTDKVMERDDELTASVDELQMIQDELESTNLELEEANRDLRKAYEHRVEVDRMKSEFVANVSHELRTPLTSIKSFSEILLDDRDNISKDQEYRYLGIIDRETDRLTRLINNLLDLRKIERTEIPWHDEEIDIRGILRETVAEFTALASKSGLSLTCEADDEVPMVAADRDRIKQVLENLISNAIKFSDNGGEVRTSVKASDRPESKAGPDCVIVSIADKGIGVSPEDHGRIFARFQQADGSTTRKKGGTGLGLAICKEIVEHYGGKIWVESEAGKGSTFSFSIPLRSSGEG